MVASDLPWTPSRVRSLRVNLLYSLSSKWRVDGNWGTQLWNASLRAGDLLMTSISRIVGFKAYNSC